MKFSPIIRGFINFFSGRATDYHRWTKLFKLNLFIKKTFLYKVKAGWQNHTVTLPGAWHLMKPPAHNKIDYFLVCLIYSRSTQIQQTVNFSPGKCFYQMLYCKHTVSMGYFTSFWLITSELSKFIVKTGLHWFLDHTSRFSNNCLVMLPHEPLNFFRAMSPMEWLL